MCITKSNVRFVVKQLRLSCTYMIVFSSLHMALPVTFRSENYSLRFNEKNFSDVIRYVTLREDSKLVIESDMAKAPNPPFSRVFVAKLWVCSRTYSLRRRTLQAMNRVCYGCYSKGGGTFQVGSANWGLDYGVACSNLLLACLLRGHSRTTWTKFCHCLTHPPSCVDNVYTLGVDKSRHFLTPPPTWSCPHSYWMTPCELDRQMLCMSLCSTRKKTWKWHTTS